MRCLSQSLWYQMLAWMWGLWCPSFSVEESKNLSSDMLGTGLVVVHDSQVSGEDDDTELTGWEDGVGEVLEVLQLEVESWRDDTALVQSSVEVDNDLSGTGIINDLKLVDVLMSLHHLEELDENLGGWSQDNL